MKKILLVTLQGANYGNRLQNYALQTVLKQMGHEVYTPWYQPVDFEKMMPRIRFFIKTALGFVGVPKYRSIYFRHRRLQRYEKFNEEYIDHRFKIRYSDLGRQDWKCYDYAVTGSDQVWHGWSSNKDELKYFYLQFMEKEKRVSYAASFGFSAFPACDEALHKKGLMEMQHLSCRENKGVELIESLTGRRAQRVLDPTLLLNAAQWEAFEKKPGWVGEAPYMVAYFLGEKSQWSEICEFSGKMGIRIIDLNDGQSLHSLMTVPEEFVWLIHHADYVFTDSFHASVFSLIYNKKFMVFKRSGAGFEDMFDRIYDLLSAFGAAGRAYQGNIEAVSEDYTVSDISVLQKESMAFLENAVQ